MNRAAIRLFTTGAQVKALAIARARANAGLKAKALAGLKLRIKAQAKTKALAKAKVQASCVTSPIDVRLSSDPSFRIFIMTVALESLFSLPVYLGCVLLSPRVVLNVDDDLATQQLPINLLSTSEVPPCRPLHSQEQGFSYFRSSSHSSES